MKYRFFVSLSIFVSFYLIFAESFKARASCSLDGYSAAYSKCLSLAKSGDPLAQFEMSTRYFTGTEGAKRDEILSYMWANMCAKKEKVMCGKFVNILEMNMSIQEIEIAKNKSAVCYQSNFQKCD
ncbi:MAG: hypothetical protein VYD75_07440 [Pseudomonadota bacterium]|nr:hypothetical protein [Pseudomonadota bacterium]MEC7974044.1 hypothetical protein [Pseudomonadota bacterium]